MTPETSIYEYGRQGLRKFPDKTALWFYGRALSFRELFARIDHAAEQLYAMGVRQGDVITIHLPNCPQAVMVFYAVVKLGAICNMVHAQTPVQGVQKLMAFAESEILFTHMPESEGIAKKLVCLDVLGQNGGDSRCEFPALMLDAPIEDYSEKAVFPEQKLLAQECAVYLHSSGSTGRPKTIMLSHSALNNCTDVTSDFFEDSISEYVCLGVLPMFHGFGLAMDIHRNISFGSTLIQMLKWDAKTAVQLIRNHGVSLMSGVPAMYYSLLGTPEFDGDVASRLKKCYVGGDNVKPELIREFDRRTGGGHHMFVGYGLTETTTTNFVNTYLHYKEGSSGYPTRGTTAAVLSENGEFSYSGEGELIISNKALMMGYLKDPKATEETLFFADGKRWTHTGDFVTIDGDGFLFFRDRIKNIISHNGYNVYPAQVEDVIRSNSEIRDVCVVGVFDEELHTQNVRAVMVLKSGANPQCVELEIKQACAEALPRYSVPKEFIFVDSFPQNALGKVDRKKMSQTCFWSKQ